MRKELRNPRAGLAVLGKFAACAEKLCAMAGAHEGETFALDERLRNDLAVEFDQLRFVIEQFQLAWTASHEEEDHVFRAGREMRRFWSERIDKLWRVVREQALVAQE